MDKGGHGVEQCWVRPYLDEHELYADVHHVLVARNGHLHCPSDYVIDTGQRRCRVLANPRGYASKGEQAQFRDCCFDI
jgi:hypothetical protein